MISRSIPENGFDKWLKERRAGFTPNATLTRQRPNHEWTTIRDEAGAEHPAELWTTCLTPRELRLMCRAVGVRVDAIHSVRPGRYRPDTPTVESEEFLVLGTRVGDGWEPGPTH